MLHSASSQQLLQSLQTNNQNNNGLIGGGSHNVITSGHNNQFNITQVVTSEGEDVELDKLLGGQVSKDALRNSYHSPPECYPNTRTTVRNEIGDWLDESVSEKSPLLWLSGPAAVGKSVIAKTVSGFHDQIVASFFFSTSSDKSAVTLFPTLAWQLARKIPGTRKHIIASLNKNSHTTQIEEQFNRLIIQPLESITALGFRPVMVIDGVDECTEENMLVRFLQVLVQAGKGGDMPVRFIICSRPELRIHTILGGVHDINLPTNKPTLQLHGLVHAIASLVMGSAVGLVGVLFKAGIMVPLGLIRLIRMFGIFPLFRQTRKEGIFHLFRLIRKHGKFDFGVWTLAIVFFPHLLVLLIQMQRTSLASIPAHLSGLMRDMLQDIWELYRPRRFGVDNHAPAFQTSDQLADTLDKICPL